MSNDRVTKSESSGRRYHVMTSSRIRVGDCVGCCGSADDSGYLGFHKNIPWTFRISHKISHLYSLTRSWNHIQRKRKNIIRIFIDLKWLKTNFEVRSRPTVFKLQNNVGVWKRCYVSLQSWASWCVKSLTARLFVQQPVQADIKGNKKKALHHWSIARRIHQSPLVSLTWDQ